MQRLVRPLTALAAGTLLLAGCAGGESGCTDLPDRVEITVTAEALVPAQPAVCAGHEVTLVLTAEVDGVLHIHGYDEEAPATPIVAGEVKELTFTASRSGQFPVELHSNDDPQGVDVGIFTVHEP